MTEMNLPKYLVIQQNHLQLSRIILVSHKGLHDSVSNSTRPGPLFSQCSVVREWLCVQFARSMDTGRGAWRGALKLGLQAILQLL